MQSTLSHFNRNTTIDILVVGGGMSGTFAAMAAGRRGLRVAIIEPSNILGGQGTVGGVAGFCGDTKNVNVLFRELVDRLTAYDLISEYDCNHDRRAYDLEGCGYVLMDMVQESGVEVYLHSRVLDAESEGGQVRTVDVATACEVVSFRPRFVIDASGSCVVVKAVGGPLVHEGAMQQLPMSLYFTLWDTGHPVEPKLFPDCPTWESDEDLPMTTLHGFPSGKVEVKMKVIGFDAADGKSLSDAEMHARKQMMGLIYHLQTKGYRGQTLNRHVLASVSRQIGIRETNRIVGEHVLTEEEVTHSSRFDDAVAVGTYHLDYHWPDRVQRAGTGITTMVEPYHIPLRSLIPKEMKNVLVPGRSASGDQMAMSSYRVMATCVQMGYAAGHAASLACECGCDVPNLDHKKLRQRLETYGQSLNLSDYGEYLRKNIHRHEHVFGADAPTPSCHASTLVQTSDQGFLAAWFAGSKEGKPDVRVWFAIRDQGRWTKPRQVPAVRDEPHWNPVLFRNEAGRIHLYFKVGRYIATWQTWVCVSDDEGRTWSEPQELVPGDDGGRGPVKNKPIVLRDGAWLAPASLEDDRGWRAFVDRSTDGGATWESSETIRSDQAEHPGVGVIQPTLWESAPGQIHMLLRSTGGQIFRSDSSDGGRSWCAAYSTDLPNNNSGLDLVRLKDGTLALVCNLIEGTACDCDNRGTISLLLSFDNGRTWPNRLDLEDDGRGEYSYPSIVATETGMAITYTWRRERIAFWHGSVERVPLAASVVEV